MPELPKLPTIPKPPRISELIPRATPLHEMIGDARAVIKQGREEITGVASYLHQGVEIPVAPEVTPVTPKIPVDLEERITKLVPNLKRPQQGEIWTVALRDIPEGLGEELFKLGGARSESWLNFGVRLKDGRFYRIDIPPAGLQPQLIVEEASEPEKPLVDKVAQGTACNICSDEHLTQTAGDLMEAMRFARQGGLTDPEAVRRVTAARAELNEMERYDLTPAQIETLSPQERVLAVWALTKSRNIRHLINTALTSKSVADLDKAAAEAERTAAEFTKRVLELPLSKGCPKCEKLVDLKAYLESRRSK